VPGLKREASETLLGMVPKKQAAPVKERPANTFKRAASQSSIDSEKANMKKAQVEAELRDAISALKRPNRALAGKEIVDAAEKRATASLSQLKKARKPTRVSSVQVKATPANNRFRDVLAPAGSSLNLPDLFREDADAIPSSSSMVPSSTAPKRTITNLLDSPAIATTPTAGKIQVTPARVAMVPSPAFHPQADSPAIPASSPIMTRKAAAPARAGGQYLSVPGSETARAPHGGIAASPCHGRANLFETPLKPRSAMGRAAVLEETPVKPLRLAGGGRRRSGTESASADAGASRVTQMTIYQQLGWDDDDEL